MSRNASYAYTSDSCPGGGNMSAVLDGAVAHPFGDQANLSFRAPANTDIAAVTLWRSATAGPYQPYGAPGAVIQWDNANGGATVADQCYQSFGCSSVGTTSSPLAASNAVSSGPLTGVNRIEGVAICGGGSGGTCPTNGGSPAAALYLYGGDITLRDASNPAVSSVQGGLVGGGTLSGTQNVSFNATDAGSGLYSLLFELDGHPNARQVLDANDGRCADLGGTSDGTRAFGYVVPCKLSLSPNVGFDTTQLTAGAHHLRLIVDDAAGNTTVAYDGQITVNNSPTNASGAGLKGATGGAGLAGGGQPGLAHIANGVTPCGSPTLDLRFRKKPSITVAYGKDVTLHGKLTCGGVPIRGAVISIASVPIAGSTVASTGDVTTATDGSFAYVAASGPSRNLTATYKAYVDDAQPSVRATAKLSVRPRITLKIAPRNTRNHARIVWRGRVDGGPLPASGVPLDLQYLDGRRWRTFDQIRTKRNGTFSYRYKFERTTRATTYSFRVTLPPGGVVDYPYSPSSSVRRSVRVRP